MILTALLPVHLSKNNCISSLEERIYWATAPSLKFPYPVGRATYTTPTIAESMKDFIKDRKKNCRN